MNNMSKTKIVHLLLFFCFSYAINGQNIENITIGKIHAIKSEILKEERKIWVHVPEELENADVVFQNKKAYPVVYLLDGDAHFNAIVGIIEHLSAIKSCPEMIVVGIPNTNRDRDLTPTKVKAELPFVDEILAANSGGGPNFISFIEKELIPYVDSNYKTENYNIFIGHSFGGLTVMNTLIEKPELFNAYVAIDPSMRWDNQKILNKIKETNFKKMEAKKSLFLGIANTMDENMDVLSVRKDTTQATLHIRSVLELQDFLKNNSQVKLSSKSKYYKEESHGSIPLIASYDAFRYIFNFYELKFDNEDFIDPEVNVANKMKNHYIKSSRVFGREIKPAEEYVNELGYYFMGMEQYKKAKEFFKMNIANYPNSFNAYDSLGDLYLASGDKQKAIESFKKSVSLNKDSYSKKKLNKLLKE